MRGEGIRLGVAGIAVSSTVSVELVPAVLDSSGVTSLTTEMSIAGAETKVALVGLSNEEL